MDTGCDYLTVGTLAETLPDLTAPIMTAADAQRRLRDAAPCRTDPESCRGAKSPKLTSVFESDSPLPPQQQGQDI
ncbi:hypothetical protein Q8A67_015953 [Cirrhinus molitorella]|uniref:Uncharacterized protein n=1 Tax=Cirrhinus molitorella TaxID=172907 RepID=A0AA88PUI2_9TELE|nr:hypothetical protein Q8A67_015953 [Cirrhinus molitorella]